MLGRRGKRCCCGPSATPCFCAGSFTDFTVIFAGFTDDLVPGMADEINGTHTFPVSSSSSVECSGSTTFRPNAALTPSLPTLPSCLQCTVYKDDTGNEVTISASIKPDGIVSGQLFAQSGIILQARVSIIGPVELCNGFNWQRYGEYWLFRDNFSILTCTAVDEPLPLIESYQLPAALSHCSGSNLDGTSATCQIQLS